MLTYKALHLIAMVAWFAGLFYIFRLFVYHVENKDKPDVVAMLNIMSQRLYYYIMIPAMVATLIFGLLLMMKSSYVLKEGWFHTKLLLLVLLIGYHHFAGYTMKRFKKGNYFLTSKACRIWNEVPTIMLIGIILLAVYRPW